MPKVIVPTPRDTAMPTPLVLHVNGRTCAVPFDVVVDLEPEFYSVLATSDVLHALAAPEAAAVDVPGGAADGGASFDAEAFITGTVGDIVAVIPTLTIDELAAVDAAEVDREKPRIGVRQAIRNAIQSLTT